MVGADEGMMRSRGVLKGRRGDERCLEEYGYGHSRLNTVVATLESVRLLSCLLLHPLPYHCGK